MSDPRLDPPPGPLTRWAAWIAWGLLPLPATEPPRPGQIRRLLVVRTDDRVGNALLTIPLVRALQRALPQAQVELLLAARRAQVAEGLPGLSIVRFEKRDAFTHPWRFLAFLRSLRARYDVVIDAAHWHAFSLTSALLSRWAASRWVVGWWRPTILLYTSAVAPPEPGIPEVVARMSLAQPLGLHLSLPPLETALGRGASPVGGRFVALNPGARKSDHLWPAARFGAVARGLRDAHGLRSVVFWGPGEEALAREVVLASERAAELAPPTNLDALAAAFRAAALVVTNDTGPMHLAVACGAPVAAVFLDEAGLRWAYPGPRFEAVVAPADEGPLLAAAAQLLDTARTPAQPASTREGPA
jgi:lipopolysaccharide heptosyltransferase III